MSPGGISRGRWRNSGSGKLLGPQAPHHPGPLLPSPSHRPGEEGVGYSRFTGTVVPSEYRAMTWPSCQMWTGLPARQCSAMAAATASFIARSALMAKEGRVTSDGDSFILNAPLLGLYRMSPNPARWEGHPRIEQRPTAERLLNCRRSDRSQGAVDRDEKSWIFRA